MRAAIAALCLATVSALPGVAGVRPLVTFNGGLAKTIGPLTSEWWPGWTAGGNFMARFGKPVGVGIRGSVNRFTWKGDKNIKGTDSMAYHEEALSIIEIYGVVRTIYEVNEDLLLFLQGAGGLDLIFTTTRVERRWNPGTTRTTDNHYGMNVGLGADINFFELGLLYHAVFDPEQTIGWVSLFGGIKLHY